MCKDKEQKAVFLLREKNRVLGRMPRKADFEMRDIQLIKSVLGPWPRALEKAGLKMVFSVKRKWQT